MARSVEGQRTQTAARSKSEENEQVDIMQIEKQKGQTSTCRYCDSTLPPQRCPAYGKRCGKCAKMNYVREVHRSMKHKTAKLD